MAKIKDGPKDSGKLLEDFDALARKPGARDLRGSRIEKVIFKPGDVVQWVKDNGAYGFEMPLVIVSVGDYEGRQFAFFDGYATGIPVDQLVFAQKNQ